jgi:hypothetical protein
VINGGRASRGGTTKWARGLVLSVGGGARLLLFSAGGAFLAVTGGGWRTSLEGRRAPAAVVGPRAGTKREVTGGGGTGLPGKAARTVGFTVGCGTTRARARRSGGTRTT